MKPKLKSLEIDSLLSLLLINLKDPKKEMLKEEKDFVDKEVFPSLKFILSQQKIKFKQASAIMKILINYKSDIVAKEFSPFFIELLNNKELYEKPEQIVISINFLEFCEKNFLDSKEKASLAIKNLNQIFLSEKSPLPNKVEK